MVEDHSVAMLVRRVRHRVLRTRGGRPVLRAGWHRTSSVRRALLSGGQDCHGRRVPGRQAGELDEGGRRVRQHVRRRRLCLLRVPPGVARVGRAPAEPWLRPVCSRLRPPSGSTPSSASTLRSPRYASPPRLTASGPARAPGTCDGSSPAAARSGTRAHAPRDGACGDSCRSVALDGVTRRARDAGALAPRGRRAGGRGRARLGSLQPGSVRPPARHRAAARSRGADEHAALRRAPRPARQPRPILCFCMHRSRLRACGPSGVIGARTPQQPSTCSSPSRYSCPSWRRCASGTAARATARGISCRCCRSSRCPSHDGFARGPVEARVRRSSHSASPVSRYRSPACSSISTKCSSRLRAAGPTTPSDSRGTRGKALRSRSTRALPCGPSLKTCGTWQASRRRRLRRSQAASRTVASRSSSPSAWISGGWTLFYLGALPRWAALAAPAALFAAAWLLGRRLRAAAREGPSGEV